MRIETLCKIFKSIALEYSPIKHIMKETELTYTTVSKIIKYLELMNFLDKQYLKKTIIYRIKKEITLSMIIDRYSQAGGI